MSFRDNRVCCFVSLVGIDTSLVVERVYRTCNNAFDKRNILCSSPYLKVFLASFGQENSLCEIICNNYNPVYDRHKYTVKHSHSYYTITIICYAPQQFRRLATPQQYCSYATLLAQYLKQKLYVHHAVRCRYIEKIVHALFD